MARKMSSGKTVCLLLVVLCLQWGAGGPGVRAEDSPDVQLVVVLDSSHPAGDSQINSLAAQAAGLLVHLLEDQDYLGLLGSGEPDETLLPTAALTPEHRKQALDTLARFAPAPGHKPLSQVMQQALGAFQSQGPKRRVLFWLGGEGGVFDDLQADDISSEIEEITAQARSEGVTLFAALMPPAAAWHTLTTETGGHCWEIRAASDLHLACLKLYQNLAQPQEVPITDSQVPLDRWVKQAVMVLTRSDPGKGVVLTDPGKARITQGTRARNIRWVAGRSCDLVTLTRPRPGVWSFTGARSEGCKAFISTDLALSAEGIPRKVAGDEALLVTAALHHAKGPQAAADLMAGTEFSAELQVHDNVLTAPLKKPHPDQGHDLSPETRTGRFPPVHQEGEGALRVLARGKNFQRLKSLSISVTPPWYRITSQTKGAPFELPLLFHPDPGHRPEQVEGSVTLKSALGSLSGILINPTPGAEIILERSSGSENFRWADLHLKGFAPDGRPLNITSGPLPLQSARRAADDLTQPSVKPDSPAEVHRENPLSLHFMQPWMWLALSALGGGVLLASALLLWRLRRQAEGFEGEDDYGGHFPTSTLRLKAQVETLVKEKAELEEALKEKQQEVKQVQKEKAEIQADLDRYQKKAQEYFKNMQDLEKKLVETDEEAKRVREEYMALYARNQREQRLLKKN